MGIGRCNIHGIMVGIGSACHHILDNIENNRNEPCIKVSIRTLFIDPTDGRESESIEVPITFCIPCYERKNLHPFIAVSGTETEIFKFSDELEFTHGCGHCISEYIDRNQIVPDTPAS